MSDQYSIKYTPEAAAVPHWLIFRNDLSYPARMLAIAIIAHQQAGSEPTRDALASDFGVNTRTVDRQLDELRAAKLLSTHRRTRRHLFSVLEPRKPLESTHGSTLIPLSTVDTWINVDNTINVDPCVYIDSSRSKAVNSVRVDPCVDSDTVGVGVGHDSIEKVNPTNTNRAPLKTALARWLKRAGMNAAREFDDPALDYATYREFVEYKRSLGWEWRQIVSTLRQAPLEPQPCDPLSQDWFDPGQLVDGQADELHQLDSTSMALTRRFEADKAEAAARARGELT